MMIKETQWLFGLAAAAHLLLTGRLGTSGDALTSAALGWFFLWNALQRPGCRPGRAPTRMAQLVGAVLLVGFLLRMPSLQTHELSLVLRVFPLVATAALVLISEGWMGLSWRFREMGIALLMGGGEGAYTDSIDSRCHVSRFTARLGAYVLWYLGFEVNLTGTRVTLPTGWVEVYSGCSGVGLMLSLVRLSLMAGLSGLVPMRPALLLGLAGLGVGWVYSGLRVSLMAILVHRRETFEIWHGPTGAEVFSSAAILTLVGLGALLLRWMGGAGGDPSPNPQRRVLEDGSGARRIGLRVVAGVMGLAMVWLLIDSRAGVRVVREYRFGEAPELAGWTVAGPLPAPDSGAWDAPWRPEEANVEHPVVAASGYGYEDGTLRLELRQRYLVYTFGDLEKYYRERDGRAPRFERRGVPGEEYVVYSDGEKRVLAACLNPCGRTTVDAATFVRNRREQDLRPGKVAQWVLGKGSLQDRRVVWVEMALSPVGPGEAAKAEGEARLEAAWRAWREAWRGRFPPL